MAASKARIEKSADAYRSIGEASAELGLEPHVLRYWETRFPRHVSPVKRPDGRRMFRPQDLDALRAIRILVHERGMTLKGAKAVLVEQGVTAVLAGTATLLPDAPASAPSPARALQHTVARAFGALPDRQERLTETLSELSDIKSRLDALRARRAG
ncbi:MAG: MerR family transcriptional regulator [Hyphomonas sp.]